MVEGPNIIICPVGLHGPASPTTPLVTVDRVPHFIHLRIMAALSPRVLGERVGVAEEARTDITNGLDRIFFGI
jgi:hypothetical protein